MEYSTFIAVLGGVWVGIVLALAGSYPLKEERKQEEKRRIRHWWYFT
jgi:hypothetical protein